MFDKEINFHHHDESLRFPSEIKITEKRAPTDESVKLLKEMESEALDNLIFKVSETRPNRFSFEVFFIRYVADVYDFSKGCMVIRFNCNGKDYSRKVTCTSKMMDLVRHYQNRSNATLNELPMALQQYVILELSLMIANMLVDTDSNVFYDLFSKIQAGDAINFDISTIEDNIDSMCY
jgi:hypothetical protein